MLRAPRVFGDARLIRDLHAPPIHLPRPHIAPPPPPIVTTRAESADPCDYSRLAALRAAGDLALCISHEAGWRRGALKTHISRTRSPTGRGCALRRSPLQAGPTFAPHVARYEVFTTRNITTRRDGFCAYAVYDWRSVICRARRSISWRRPDSRPPCMAPRMYACAEEYVISSPPHPPPPPPVQRGPNPGCLRDPLEVVPEE